MQYFPAIPFRRPTKKHTSHKFIEYEPKERYELDDYTKFKGVFAHKYDFIVTYLLASVGLGNVRRFPRLVYLHGGAAFLVLYILLSIAFGIPMFILECGLSQFYGVGESRLFNIVPYFRGLGWSIHVLNLLLFIPYSFEIQWYLNYLIHAIRPGKPPWEFCRKVPGIVCVELQQVANNNSVGIKMSPSKIFMEFEIKGIRRLTDGALYTFNTALDGMKPYQLLLIFVIWLFILIFTWFVTKLYTKVNYILFLSALLILIVLTAKSLFLTGGFSGISHYLNPSLQNLFTRETIKDAVTQVMFSLSITKSCSSFGSLNPFKFNFLKASYLIILGDFSFSFVSGIMLFSILGYLSKKLNTDIRALVMEDMTLIDFLDASVLNADSKVWVCLFMLMMIIVGITTICAICSSFVLSCLDSFPEFINNSENKKTLIVFLTCGVLFTLTTFFSMKGSFIYIATFSKHNDYITSPLMMLNEVILVQYIYGSRRLRLEVKMMIGYTYNVIFVFFSVTLVPILIIFVLIHTVITEPHEDEPMWAILLTLALTIIPLLPLIFCFLFQVVKNIRNEKKTEIVSAGFKTPDYYGPYYKMDWLLSKYYQQKLVRNRKNPEFLETIRETEDLDEILEKLKEMYDRISKAEAQIEAARERLRNAR